MIIAFMRLHILMAKQKCADSEACACPLQDVSRVLALLGIACVMKAVSEDGLFAFNLALPDR
jgi:hypothetical protein